MGGDPDSDEFEDEDDELDQVDEGLDLDRAMRDMDSAKRRAVKGAEPAWRKLEQRLEQKQTAELISDFDDYEIGLDKPAKPRR